MLTIQFKGDSIRLDLERNSLPVFDVDHNNVSWGIIDWADGEIIYTCPSGWSHNDAWELIKAIGEA